MRKAWTKRNETRLRQEPDHGGQVLRLLPARTELEVLELEKRFTKVRLQDKYTELTGYIATDFLDIEPDDAPLAPNPRYAHLLPCPRCASNNWGKFSLQQSGGHMGQNFYIPTGFLTGATVFARICLRCGYLELCVDEDDLSTLRQLDQA